jgi:hypothetical protein
MREILNISYLYADTPKRVHIGCRGSSKLISEAVRGNQFRSHPENAARSSLRVHRGRGIRKNTESEISQTSTPVFVDKNICLDEYAIN